MELIQLENEIKLLLSFRMKEYGYDLEVVEAYMAMDMSVMCRIELFREKCTVEARVAKYEARVKEGFYYEAEKQLIRQLLERRIGKSIPPRKAKKKKAQILLTK